MIHSAIAQALQTSPFPTALQVLASGHSTNAQALQVSLFLTELQALAIVHSGIA